MSPSGTTQATLPRGADPHATATAERTRHVTMFTPSAYGGHARYTRELLTAVAEEGRGRGFRPSLVTSADLAEEHRTDAYPIHAVLPRLVPRDAMPGAAAWALSRLAHYPRRERALLRWADRQPRLDLLHAQELTPWLAPWLYRALRRRGVAVVETVHNIHPHAAINALHRRASDALSRASWRSCRGLIVHTEGLRGELSQFLGAGHPPIFVTPHGVWNVDADAPSPADPGRPLLFFGVVRENKGLHVLIRAMGDLPGVRLIAAGHFPSSSYRDEVLRLAEDYAPGRVEFRDRFVSEAEASALFEGAGLVVLPYTSFASQSGVLHQALAHGRPVVVSDVGALGESVRSWGIGLVVPAESPPALAAGIRAAREPAAFEAAATAARRIRASLSWSRTAALTLDAYEAVLGGPAAPVDVTA